MGECQNYNTEEKQDIKERVLCDPIHLAFYNSKTNLWW